MIMIYLIMSAILIAIIVLLQKKDTKDNFNIATDPRVDTSRYEHAKETCPARNNVKNNVRYNGLNPQDNDNLSLTEYISKYGMDENYRGPNTCDVNAKRYCNFVYATHREYFADRWSGIGECELAIKDKCEEMFPLAPKKTFWTGY